MQTELNLGRMYFSETGHDDSNRDRMIREAERKVVSANQPSYSDLERQYRTVIAYLNQRATELDVKPLHG
jgi:hypothetical protein